MRCLIFIVLFFSCAITPEIDEKNLIDNNLIGAWDNYKSFEDERFRRITYYFSEKLLVIEYCENEYHYIFYPETRTYKFEWYVEDDKIYTRIQGSKEIFDYCSYKISGNILYITEYISGYDYKMEYTKK
jgi:hypothetical protein